MTDRPSWIVRYREAVAALAAAQKPSAGTAAYGRFVNRPLGRRFAAAGHTWGMSPDQATALSATLSALAIASIALVRPTVVTGVVVAVLLAVGYAWDSADGQISRLRSGGSLSGEWLDHTIDCFKTCLLHLAVLVSWYRWPPVDDRAVLLVPMAFQVVAVVTFFGLILVPTLRPTRNAGSTLRDASVAESRWRPFLMLPLDYGVVCWVFVLLGWRAGFLVGYSFFALCAAGGLALALAKWWRELRMLDRAAAA